MRVLLTGATGFVGMEVLARLIGREDVEIIALIRARDPDHARRRLDGVLERLYEDPKDLRSRLIALPADVRAEQLGLSRTDRRLISSTADAVVHCAASISFDLPREAAMNTNAAGTARLLALAAGMRRLERFVHVSTAYVAGRTRGRFGEDDLDRGQDFRNSYELSKFEAERMIAERAAELPIVVARPSIIVGDRHSGWTPSFNALYWPLRAFARGLIRELPVDPAGVVDVVPVDYVADALVHLLDGARIEGRLQLVAGERALSNGELIALACRYLEQRPPRLDGAARLPEEARVYLPYFDVETRFDDAHARLTLGRESIQTSALQDFFATLMRYADSARWGKRSITREAAARASIVGANLAQSGGTGSRFDESVPNRVAG
jgi:thioester reductase-like protein